MINSLLKDSHITQSFCLQNSMDSSERRTKRTMSQGASVNNSIVIKNPANLSFRGVSDIKLASESIFQKLIEEAKTFLGNKTSQDSIKDLINKVVSSVSEKANIEDNLKPFLTDNKQNIESIIEKSKELLTAEHIKKPLNADVFDKEVKKTIEDAVKVLPSITDNQHKIYKSDKFKNFLQFANEYQTLFGASFAVLLTCLLRPVTIMALPGEKKNKDDKKYASAHSIASGAFGFGLALLVSAPISKAVKKVLANPQNYNISKNLGKLTNKKNGLFKETANNYLNQLPDILLAAPKAMITIALMPVVLKYVFGVEKKKSGDNKLGKPIEQHYPSLNFKSSNTQDRNAFKEIAGGVK